jgi:hypothetical protein
LIEKGTCRMGNKCYFSHDIYSSLLPSSDSNDTENWNGVGLRDARGGRGIDRDYRGGMRGGRGGKPMNSTARRDHTPDSTGIISRPFRGGREGFRGNCPYRIDFNPGNSIRKPERMITLKRND